jgi:hypothetical protein
MSRHARDPTRRDERPDEEGLTERAHEAAPIAFEPPQMSDARLSQGRNEPLRVAMLRQAQQGYGNRAVGRMLAREPNPALETKTAEAKPKVGHKTGKEIDAYLDASPFFKKLVADAVKSGKKAEGHVHIWTKAEFLTKCEAYLTGKENPNTSAPFTAAEAKEFAKNVNAYQEGTEIHVNEERGEAATTVHEAIHLFQKDDFMDKAGWNANEGATEFFTRKLCAEQKPAIPRSERFYADQYKSIKKLVAYLGSEDVLAEAYFHAKVAELQAAVDKKAGASGAGTYAKWVGFMQQSKFAQADALL